MSTLIATLLVARFTILVPLPEERKAFEEGYRRHLEWHRRHDDPWAWHGWTVISGERYGTFIDATIGRTPEEMDRPVAPAEDAADMAENVLPAVGAASTALYRLRPDLCAGTAEAIAAPFASLVRVRVRPGRRQELERTLAARRPVALCFELLSGGETPSYLLVFPYRELSAVLRGGAPPVGTAAEAVSVELLRYRPDLSYLPGR